MKMLPKERLIVEVIHDVLTQIIGGGIRVQAVEQFSKSCDMCNNVGMDYVSLDIEWNEL
jgi:hypothetical protein